MKYATFNLSLLLLIISAIPGSTQPEEGLRITHGPYIQQVSETGTTIAFTTNKSVVPGILLRSGSGDYRLIQNSTDGLVDVGDNLHKIRIDDLQPGTDYEYKLYAKEILIYRPYECVFGDTLLSGPYQFKTLRPDAPAVHFTVFCDLHDQPGKLSKYLNSNDVDKQDLYFMNGDIMSYIVEERQIFSSFIDTCVNRFATGKPFYYVRGNHETRGKFARQFKDYLALPDGKYYYSMDIGPAHFIILDGGEDKPDTAAAYFGMADFDPYRMKELEWLKREVHSEAFRSAPFRIVIVHMPIIQKENNWHGMAFMAEHFGPVLRDAGIDLMISGHTHKNTWIESGSSGFGYPVMISSNNNYIEAEVNGEQISLLLKNVTGRIVEEYRVKRK